MLDPFQSAAAHTAEGAYLILAGPGSGKTTMLLERVLYLINEKKVPPEKLLLITFTRDAAAEMALRFKARCEGAYLPVTFSTFHSFFYQILKRTYGFRQQQILTGKARRELMGRVLYSIGEKVDPKDEGFFETLEKELSRMENSSIPGVAEPEVSDTFSLLSPEGFCRFREGFAREKREAGLIDFDDMQSRCLALLRRDPEALSYWKNRFSYYMVDESQDMNRMQYEILRLLTKDRGNVFAVGDDDQSIYAFRGADPKVLKRYAKEYEGCKILYLKMNYRSDRAIVDAASRVICHNKNRFEKEFIPDSREEGILRYRSMRTREEEMEEILNRIRSRVRNGRVTEDTAATCRGWPFKRPFMTQGSKGSLSIPFTAPRGWNSTRCSFRMWWNTPVPAEAQKQPQLWKRSGG